MRIVILTAATLLAGTASAAETMATKSFESLDKRLSDAFATADTNSDGVVSKEEVAKWRESQAK
jgi:Ca2+-binding EF-hand superfamily protein